MAAGLEVYSPAGNLVFSSQWGHSRILGSFTLTTTTGSRVVTTADGSPIGEVFAYVTPFVDFYGGSNTLRNAVWTVDNTIHWLNCAIGFEIVYGDGYA